MSKLLIAESPLQVLPSLVKALGGSKYLLDAMFLQQIQFWLSNPKMGIDIDGVKFVSFTYKEWHKQFSWVEVDTLKDLVARNKDRNLIIVGQYSENPMDKTNYYSINYDALDTLLNEVHPPVEQVTHDPVEGGDERISSGGLSTTSQRINTKKADSSNSKPAKTDEVKGEYKLPENSDPAFLMAVGQDITSEAQKQRQIENEAILAFEASFSALKPLLWYCGKPKWTNLRKDVVELYKADSQCFEKYKLWRTTPYVKGAVSLKDIQRDPDCFMASWAGFVEANPKESESNKFEGGSAYV